MASFVKQQGYDLHHFPPPRPNVGVGSPHVARPIEDTASFPLNTPINLWHTDNGVKCSLKDEKQIQQIFPSENCPLVGWRTIFGRKTKHCKGKVICCSFFVFSSKCSMLSCNKLGKEAKQANRYIARQYQSAVMLTGQLCPHYHRHHSPICFSMVDLFTLSGSQTTKNKSAECRKKIVNFQIASWNFVIGQA